jgi:hypothetical protein
MSVSPSARWMYRRPEPAKSGPMPALASTSCGEMPHTARPAPSLCSVMVCPSQSGAPPQITLPTLASLSKHAEPGVRFFSGVATYTRTISIDKALLGKGRRLHLDLGQVAVMAEVKLNGRPLGVKWKAPFIVDITEAARPGENALEVRVVNLPINRMLGDEELPEDSSRRANGTLRSWPQWLAEGQPSPTGRYTFTSWRLWKKGEPLPDSGLIGPVTLRPAVLQRVKE